MALEWLRTYLGGGFPWNLAGYSWVDVPGALPLSAWIGAYGISFLALLTSVAVAASIQRRRWEPAAIGLLIPLLLLPLAGRWSLRRDAVALARDAAASAAPCACCSRTSRTSSPTTRRR